MKPLTMHTNSPAADEVVVVISAAFVPSHKVPDSSLECFARFVFWRLDGVSYDVRLSFACVEEPVLNVHLKCIGFIHPPSLLYIAMHRSTTTLQMARARKVIFTMHFLKPVCGVCLLFPSISKHT